MKLHQIPSTKGKKSSKRRGQGPGSGNGKTAGRGHKGAKSRSGYSMPTNYSGIPWYRRLPMRGFSNHQFTKRYDVVNLSTLDKIEGVEEIDRDALVHAGILRNSSVRFKILAEGEINRPVTVKADKVSASAKKKIEAAGGKVIVLEDESKEQKEEATN